MLHVLLSKVLLRLFFLRPLQAIWWHVRTFNLEYVKRVAVAAPIGRGNNLSWLSVEPNDPEPALCPLTLQSFRASHEVGAKRLV